MKFLLMKYALLFSSYIINILKNIFLEKYFSRKYIFDNIFEKYFYQEKYLISFFNHVWKISEKLLRNCKVTTGKFPGFFPVFTFFSLWSFREMIPERLR